MANILCIPPAIVERLQNAIKAGKFKIDANDKDFMIEKFRKLSFDKQVSFINQFIENKPMSEFISAQFLSAYFDKRKNAMNTFIKNTFYNKSPKTADNFRKNVNTLYTELQNDLSKIDRQTNKDNIQEKIQANYDYAKVLIQDKLGIEIKPEEVSGLRILVDKINKLEEEFNKTAENKTKYPDIFKNKTDGVSILDSVNNYMMLDDADFKKYVIGYFNARKEITDYLYQLNPASIAARIISTTSGALLAGLKSAFVNVIGNATTFIDTRLPQILALGDKQFLNTYQRQLREKYTQRTRELFQKTGYDLTRAIIINNDERTWLGESEHAKLLGDNWFTATVKWFYEDIVFGKFLMLPDVRTASNAFAQSLSATVYKELRRTEPNLKDKEFIDKFNKLFIAATAIEPKANFKAKESLGKAYDDNIAIRLRNIAVESAKLATFTNETWASKSASTIMKFLNIIPETLFGVRAARLFIPFMKIPANFTARMIDNSGILVGKVLWNTGAFLKDNYLKKQPISATQKGQLAIQQTIAAGLLTTISYILYALLKPDDEEGMTYSGTNIMASSSKRELSKELGKGYDSIRVKIPFTDKIANVSVDLFGIFGGTMRTFALLNKYKTAENVLRLGSMYAQDMFSSVQKIPGIKEFVWLSNDIRDSLEKINSGKMSSSESAIVWSKMVIDFVTPRVIPAIYSDLIKGLNNYQLKNEIDKPFSKLIYNVIPSESTYIPAINMFGEPKPSKNPITQIFFGARMSFETENKYAQELNRLNRLSELPPISDIQYLNKKMRELRVAIGSERFDKLARDIGRNFKSNVDEFMAMPYYKDLTADEQRQEWKSAREDAIDQALFDNDIVIDE